MSDTEQNDSNQVYQYRPKKKANESISNHEEAQDQNNHYEEPNEVDKDANDNDEGTLQTNQENQNNTNYHNSESPSKSNKNNPSQTQKQKQAHTTNKQSKSKKNIINNPPPRETTKLPDIYSKMPNNRYKKVQKNLDADELYQQLYYTKNKMSIINQELQELKYSYGDRKSVV